MSDYFCGHAIVTLTSRCRGLSCLHICVALSDHVVVVFADPTENEKAMIERCEARGASVGMPFTTTVIGYHQDQDRDQRCAIGQQAALRSRGQFNRCSILLARERLQQW